MYPFASFPEPPCPSDPSSSALGVVAVAALAYTLYQPRPSDAATMPASRVSGETAPATAVFAGGCFWCMEEALEALPGVTSVVSGYIGGSVANPTYEQVSAGGTGHTEAVQVTYDAAKVNYAQLLDLFWHNIDPLVADAQFCDHGSQYRSEIFPGNAEERAQALASRAAIATKFSEPIATRITDATTFYVAEEYHQDYYKKNPIRYKYYQTACGRASRLKELWGSAAGVGTLGLIKAD